MSLNAVQLYLQSVLEGLEAPGMQPVSAWVLPPPVVQLADNPHVFVWGGDLTEERATIPRMQAQKRILHTPTLTVMWTSENDSNTVQNFPLLLDAIRAMLRTIPLPVQLVDPTTGEQSDIHDIGERITVRYPVPVALADQRYIQHNAVIRPIMFEWLNPA